MAETKKNYFEELNGVNVSDKIEKKNGLSYLSWAYAWGELKKKYPDSNYRIYEIAEGWNYFSDGRTCWVKTGVTVNGIEHIEYLPVMDFKNKSIPANAVTSFDVNKAIQRSLTKAVARHGLGLYIYAGEDLREESGETPAPVKTTTPKKTTPAPKAEPKTEEKTEKKVISEESKKIRREFMEYCAAHKDIVDWQSYGLTNDSTDKAFKDALNNAKAKVAEATSGGELPFPLD